MVVAHLGFVNTLRNPALDCLGLIHCGSGTTYPCKFFCQLSAVRYRACRFACPRLNDALQLSLCRRAVVGMFFPDYWLHPVPRYPFENYLLVKPLAEPRMIFLFGYRVTYFHYVHFEHGDLFTGIGSQFQKKKITNLEINNCLTSFVALANLMPCLPSISIAT
uniref:Uncharacterized protein n=1 Tax=Salmonella sp. TaxID=599 RepID=A0A482ETD8_SALSP|nr:hypothetical protein [Salmonella sp.]QBM91380.1 hypothetical protein NNIBIDOC_00047 [Salmonella sp.]